MRCSNKLAFMALTAFFLGSIPAVVAQENLSEWAQVRNIAVNTKPGGSGGNVPGNVMNYPLLVRLDSANGADIFSAALTGGVDIRFSKPSGARLRFQRERWDAVARRAEFWVLMDTVKGNDSLIALRIHWGKAGAPDSSRASSVFSPANGFVAVWHMNETVAVAGDSIVDATGTGHRGTLGLEGTGVAAPANITTGIGIGKNFTGPFEAGATITTGAYFLMSNADSALNLNTNTGPFTITAWANPAICDATARMGLLSKYANVNTNPTGGRAYTLQTANVDGNWRLTMDPSAFADTSSTATITEYVADSYCTPNEWTYLAVGYNSNGLPPTPDEVGAVNAKIFRAGPAGTDSTIGFTATQQPRSVGRNANVYIGRIHNIDRLFRGGIDEVRIANVDRSASWKKLDYETQKPGSWVVNVGARPVSISPARAARGVMETGIQATGSSVRFLLTEATAGASLSIVDMSGREVWSFISSGESRTVTWDGTASTGHRAPPGGYVARVILSRDGKSQGTVTESRVVLLR